MGQHRADGHVLAIGVDPGPARLDAGGHRGPLARRGRDQAIGIGDIAGRHLQGAAIEIHGAGARAVMPDVARRAQGPASEVQHAIGRHAEPHRAGRRGVAAHRHIHRAAADIQGAGGHRADIRLACARADVERAGIDSCHTAGGAAVADIESPARTGGDGAAGEGEGARGAGTIAHIERPAVDHPAGGHFYNSVIDDGARRCSC